MPTRSPGLPAPDPEQQRPTAERILDAAEGLFAEKGYAAASLGEVADRVGIRTPSLYNHFRNKEALYQAVLERLLVEFAAPLAELEREEVTYQRVFDWLEAVIRQHHANPNLARLLQHAALSGGPHTGELIDRLFRPLFQRDTPVAGDGLSALGEAGLRPWAVMALNNLVMSYVTMAPMYAELLGQDPLGEAALENQLKLVKILLRAVIEYRAG